MITTEEQNEVVNTSLFIRKKLSGFSLVASQYFVKSSLTYFLNGFQIRKISSNNNNPY